MKSTKVQITAGIALLMIACAGGYVASSTVGQAYAQNSVGTQQRVVCYFADGISETTNRLDPMVQSSASEGWRTDQISPAGVTGYCLLQSR